MNNAASGSGQWSKPSGLGTVSAAQATAGVLYNLATNAYTVTVGARSQTFRPADIDASQSSSASAVYLRTSGETTDSLLLTKPGTSGPLTYQYVGAGFWQRTTETASSITGSLDAFAYGVVTPDAAVPRSGRAEYAVSLIGIEGAGQPLAGTGVTQIDFGSGDVITHGEIISPSTASFQSEAKLSASANSFSGVFGYGSGVRAEGQLNGRLFGPAGQEIGGAFWANNTPNGVAATGVIIGRGGAVTSRNTSMTALSVNEFFANDAAVNRGKLTGANSYSGFATTGGFTGGTAAPTSLIVNYDAALQAYTLVSPTGSAYFGPGRSVLNTETLTGAPAYNVTPTQYVAGRLWTQTIYTPTGYEYVWNHYAFGVETAASAIPRTGRGGFRIFINGLAADGAHPNIMKFEGQGAMSADFATGAITGEGGVDYAEDYYIASGYIRSRASGTFSLTGAMNSASNRLAGTISLTGLGAYSGALNGRFYGPAAEEVGAAFSATNGAGGSMSGVLLGGSEPALLTPVPDLLSLTTLMTLAADGRYDTIFRSSTPTTHYNPATQTYDFALRNGSVVAFGPAELDAGQSTAALAIYNAPSTASTARIFKPGAGNPKLALSYTSFADITRTVGGFPQQEYFTFGVATPDVQMPRVGTASYSGIVVGHGKIGAAREVTVDGTSALTADFTNRGIEARLNVSAKEVLTGSVTTLTPITYIGAMTGSSFFGGSNGESLVGRFYGVNAKEFGATFNHQATSGTPAGDAVNIVGVTVGKRAP